MARRDRNPFLTVTSTGGLLPVPLLERLATAPDTLPGTSPEDYELTPGKRLREIINRSWNDLLGAWQTYRTKAEQLAPTDPGLALTRDRWLLPLLRELGWHAIEPANGSGMLFVEAEDSHLTDGERRKWPITHEWGSHVPVHLLGWNVPLDSRTPGFPAAATAAPHSVVQDFLNAADTHLWGVVCNGRQLRILRDSTSLTRQSFVEFDLETMFDNQVFADFVVLWMLAHATRFAPQQTIQDCWLEQWQHASDEQGVRALEDLRKGVEDAIAALGTGLLAHPANQTLRAALRDGSLDRQDLYRQLLRLVYRLVFLFVVEDRDLLHTPEVDHQTRDLYARHYSTSRLRDQAGRHVGGRHPDGWAQLRVLLEGLAADDGIPALGLPSLAGGLFDPDWSPDLADTQMANKDLYAALRALAFTTTNGVRSRIDFRNLGSEELGSVYESLLELHPTIDPDQRLVSLDTAAGHERKTTGAYYTPASLIAQVLDDALDPIVEETIAGKDGPEAEAAILDLTVCDPACGSAHFLVAASHRLAKYVAIARTGDPEPAPMAIQQALRDVVSRCIHGVDVNPMAVELAKVSLWLECHVPGQPLTFLDHHIKCGNSLMGVHSPELIEWKPQASKAAEQKGVYDAAFTVLHGDDKPAVNRAKKRNKTLRSAKEGQGALVLSFEESTPAPAEAIRLLADDASEVRAMNDASLVALRAKRRRWQETEESSSLRRERLRADAWCASFTLPKTTVQLDKRVQQPWDVYYALSDGQDLPDDNQGVIATRLERDKHRFFHWYLEFPDIHDRGGFDVMLGNPPWDRVKEDPATWFSSRRPAITAAKKSSDRNKMIAKLRDADPGSDDARLVREWDDAVRLVESAAHFMRNSGRFPHGGVGEINTYAVFTDLFLRQICPTGRAGLIVQSGIATGSTYQNFFWHLIESRSLATCYIFENEAKLFRDIKNNLNFVLLTLTGTAVDTKSVAFTGFVRHVPEVKDPERRYELTPEELEAINPNTKTAPVFRHARDATITAHLHRVAPVLVREEPARNRWQVDTLRMFDMANDSGSFVERDEWRAAGGREADDGVVALPDSSVLVPLYEGKMIWHYNHRHGTYEGRTQKQANKGVLPETPLAALGNPGTRVLPHYWIDRDLVDERLDSKEWDRLWLMGWRDKTRTDRTLIPCVVPRVGVGHSMSLLLPDVSPPDAAVLLALLSSFVADYAARQKIGNESAAMFVVRQLPILGPQVALEHVPWGGETVSEFVLPRILELTFTADDLAAWASDLGDTGRPFRFDPDRRAVLAAELDALIMHLYGLDRDQAAWIMDSFTTLCRYEERSPEKGGFDEFRTKRLILERFDAMSRAGDAGEPYATVLAAPPAASSQRHP